MKVGLSLRQTTYSPSLIVSIASRFDGLFSSLIFPTLTSAASPLDLSALALGATRKIRVGTGVVRLQEQDPEQLANQAKTLAQASDNRFILGIGTGTLAGKDAVSSIVNFANRLRTVWRESPVPLHFAALGPRMIRTAFEHADGALLNLCPPSYVESVLQKDVRKGDGFELSCLVKLFFAVEDGDAKKLMVDELTRYDGLPQYHRMFESMGAGSAFAALRNSGNRTRSIPEGIAAMAACNPTRKEISGIVRRFRDAGVDNPVISPNVVGDDGYKLGIVRMLGSV